MARFPLPCDEQRPVLHPPRFGLATIFWIVALAAVAVAAVRFTGPRMAATLILLLLAIGAHVAGNVLGTRLRSSGNIVLGASDRRRGAARLEPHHFLPITRLGRRVRLGRGLFVLTALAAVAGAVGGGYLLALVNWQRATVGNISLACLSCGVLGGIWGFWVGSFTQVLFQALVQAHRESDRR
jgi:hypothetical protein